MWSQSSSDSQTYQVSEHSNHGADSGFESGTSDTMRDCSRVSSVQLSETILRNIQMNHSNRINNLDAARTHRQQLQDYQQNIPNSMYDSGCDQVVDKLLNTNSAKCDQIDRLQSRDMLKKGYEYYYTQDVDGDTHLHISIAMKHVEATMWLIEQAPHPCLLDIANDNMLTALHLAVMASQPMTVRRLMLAGSNPRLQTRSGDTALHVACTRGDLDCAKALTEPFTPAERTWLVRGRPLQSNNLELRNFLGKTCLHIAAEKGDVDLVKQLVRCGADVETQEGLGGRTALHLAVRENCGEVVRWLLLERPSCIDKTTYAGQTAYQIAAKVNLPLAQELLSFGANPELSDSDSESNSGDSSDGSESSYNDEKCQCQGELADHFV